MNITKLSIGIIFLWVIACQKEQNAPETINKPIVIAPCDEGCRSGIAPFLNIGLLSLDSTNVVSNHTQIQFNGSKIASITSPLSGGQPALYLGILYNHYNSCTITFADGSKWVHNKPIYITHTGNLSINGPLTNWSQLDAIHPDNLVRYVRTTVYKPAYLPLRGENWRLYTYLVNGRRIELLPTNKSYRHFRIF